MSVDTQVIGGKLGHSLATDDPLGRGGLVRFEHLHLHMRRTHWETKCHSDLGPHLQDALDALDREGWEVVTSFCTGHVPELILRRTAPLE